MVLLRLWVVVTCVYSNTKEATTIRCLIPKGWNSFFILFYLILLLYSLADQFSSSNYNRNDDIRIGNDKRRIPNLLLLFFSSLSFPLISFPFFFFIQPPVRINNRKSLGNSGAHNPGQSEYDINL